VTSRLTTAFPIAWRNAVYSSTMSSRAKAVAGAVGIHMSKNGGSIRPSLERLEAETSLSRHTVVRGLSELREWGFLELAVAGGGRRRTSIYRALIPNITVQQLHSFAQQTVQEAHRLAGETVQLLPETVQIVAVNSAPSAQEDVKEDVHKDVTSLEGKRRAFGGRRKKEGGHVDVKYLDG